MKSSSTDVTSIHACWKGILYFPDMPKLQGSEEGGQDMGADVAWDFIGKFMLNFSFKLTNCCSVDKI